MCKGAVILHAHVKLCLLILDDVVCYPVWLLAHPRGLHLVSCRSPKRHREQRDKDRSEVAASSVPATSGRTPAEASGLSGAASLGNGLSAAAAAAAEEEAKKRKEEEQAALDAEMERRRQRVEEWRRKRMQEQVR